MNTNKLGTMLSLLLTPALASADASSNTARADNVTVTMNTDAEGLLRVEATQASWPQVFAAIEARTGLRTHYSAPADAAVNVNCRGATVEQIITCLAGPNANLIFSYSRDSADGAANGRLVEAWIIGKSLAAQEPTLAVPRSSAGDTTAREESESTALAPVSVDSRASEADLSREARDWEAAIAAAPASAAHTEHTETPALIDVASAADAEDRAQALAQLALEGPLNDVTVRAALEVARSDVDPSVRAQAVYGLARREGPAAAPVLYEALRDPNADVRLMAVDSAGTDATGVAVLRQALADQDETVRELATTKLRESAPAADATQSKAHQ